MRAVVMLMVLTGCAYPAEAYEGQPCGECGAGTVDGGACVYPTMDVDQAAGLPAADTGSRQVFSPESYSGTDYQKVQQAIWAAQAVAGAVVLPKVYELDSSLAIGGPLMVTGGGLRRACTPVATLTVAATAGDTCVEVDTTSGFAVGQYLLAVTGPSYAQHLADIGVSSASGTTICATAAIQADLPVGTRLVKHTQLLSTSTPRDGIIVDSVFFDGANDCNGYTHEWKYNHTGSIRGANVVRNSVFYDLPSENWTTCGATLIGNRSFQLQGSFAHKSCSQSPEPIDILADNYIDGVNLSGDAVMGHSEGAITFSANAGTWAATGNVFRNGGEGVWGLASQEDDRVVASGDCYAHFPRVVMTFAGTDLDTFIFRVELVDVPTVFAVWGQ